MRLPTIPFRAIVLALAVTLSGPLQTVVAHGVSIGRDSAGHLRAVVRVPVPVQLPPSIFPGTPGWADAEPGLASAEIEDPANDLFLLDPNCDIQFILVGMDEGIQIVTDHVWVPGETFEFGQPFFDDHLVFDIPDGVIGQTYALQFRLHDLAGIHADSPVYTLTFTPVNDVCSKRGDLNLDDSVRGSDIQAFVNCVLETPPDTTPDSECICADMDGDGALDDNDVELFCLAMLAD